MSYLRDFSCRSFSAFVVIFKHSGIIIENVYLVLLVPVYLLVRSVITGLRILGILQRNEDFILLEDLP